MTTPNTRIDLVNAQIHRGTKAERLAMVIKDAGLHLWFEIDSRTQLEESCWIVDVDPTTDPPFAHEWRPFCVSAIEPVLGYDFAGGATEAGNSGTHVTTGYFANDTGQDLIGAIFDTRAFNPLRYLIRQAAGVVGVSLFVRSNSLHNQSVFQVVLNGVTVIGTINIPAGFTGPMSVDIITSVSPGDTIDTRLTISESTPVAIILSARVELRAG